MLSSWVPAATHHIRGFSHCWCVMNQALSWLNQLSSRFEASHTFTLTCSPNILAADDDSLLCVSSDAVPCVSAEGLSSVRLLILPAGLSAGPRGEQLHSEWGRGAEGGSACGNSSVLKLVFCQSFSCWGHVYLRNYSGSFCISFFLWFSDSSWFGDGWIAALNRGFPTCYMLMVQGLHCQLQTYQRCPLRDYRAAIFQPCRLFKWLCVGYGDNYEVRSFLNNPLPVWGQPVCILFGVQGIHTNKKRFKLQTF